jgi:hypothetical protein
VNHGRWLFDCPVCGNSGLATPGISTVQCTACVAEHRVSFPDDRAEIERLLLARPNAENRNWREPETVEDLRRENEAHAVPS